MKLFFNSRKKLDLGMKSPLKEFSITKNLSTWFNKNKENTLKEITYGNSEDVKQKSTRIWSDTLNWDKANIKDNLSCRDERILKMKSWRRAPQNLRYGQRIPGDEEHEDLLQHQNKQNLSDKIQNTLSESNENSDIYRKAVSSKRPKIPKNSKSSINSQSNTKSISQNSKQKTHKLSINLEEDFHDEVPSNPKQLGIILLLFV